MANFDMAELALKSVCPNNAMKYDDKEMPSIMVFIPKFRLCDVLSTADTSVHPATTTAERTACPARTRPTRRALIPL